MATQTRQGRRWPLIVAAIAVAGLAIWFWISVAVLGWHAYGARSSLNAMTEQITAGDTSGAAASIESARSDVVAAQQSITSLPIAALNVVPFFRTNLDGADRFLSSAQELLDASVVINDVYANLTGGTGEKAVFDNGTINIGPLQRIEPQMMQMSDDISRAQEFLDEIPDDISPVWRGVVDQTADRVDGASRALRVYEGILPELPVLLGEDEPATYLVVFHNPGELYAGGGAALNAALMQFDNGKMEIVDKGAVSSYFFPGNPSVPWNPVAKGPYYAQTGAEDGFAWSNLHQDFRISGEDMMRSWVANGGAPVDGVISLDPVALQAAVAASGPIESTLYGEVDADNLVNKLLYEEYNEDAASQEQRHQANQKLIDEVFARMQSSSGALTIGRAMISTAPGQHIRIYLSDERLEKVLRDAGTSGEQPQPQPDRIAFYTQNQNASKVDIFQARKVIHNVRLNADGSAHVVQTAEVTNNAPDNGTPLSRRKSYTTRWAFHWNIVLLPAGAQDVKLAANPGQIKQDERVFTDVDGREAVRVGRWIPPGESSIVTVSYDLPAGTFGSDGVLDYRVGVEHQLTVADTDLTVNVLGPSAPEPREGEWRINGALASTAFPVSEPTTLAVAFGGG